MKSKLFAYLGLLGLIVLVAMLISVRDVLPSIAIKILTVLLALAALALGYLLFWLYNQFKRTHLATQARIHELKASEQQLAIERERWDVERSTLLLAQQIQVSRIYPDGKGYLPTLVQVSTDGSQQFVSLPHPALQGRSLPAGEQGPALPERASSLQGIPDSIGYEAIRSQIPAGHSLLGISASGLETCDFRDLMTMLISGGSSTGKSNTVAIKLHEAVSIGRNTRMIVIDPHKNKPDSLYNKIRQYEPRFLMPVASKDDEIIQALTWFKREFNRRLELATEELEQLDDILLVCDEVYALVYHREDERISKLIKVVSGIAGYESRGYGMFAWFLTQKVTGLKWLRDAVMTTICHKMQTMAERVLAANDNKKVAQDMDNWTMPGRVVVFGLNLPVTVAQMPLMKTAPNVRIVESDLDEMEELQPRQAFRTGSPKRNDETMIVSADETNGEAARNDGKILAFRVSEQEQAVSSKKETGGVSDETKKTIMRMYRANMPLRDIARLVGLSGEKYSLFKSACQEMGIQPAQVIEG